MNNKRQHSIELMVGYFIAVTVFIIILFSILSIMKGEFSFFTNKYKVYYELGNGLAKGTVVTLNGIPIGKVSKVIIDEKNRIEVQLEIISKYQNKIRSDSIAKIVRPMLIGRKQISISPGSIEATILANGSVIKSEESSELIDLVSGVSIDKYRKNNEGGKGLIRVDGELSLSSQEIYNQAVNALVLLNDFQKSIQEMSENMSSLSDSMRFMGRDLSAMSTLSASMQDMANQFKELSKISDSMMDLGVVLNNVNDGFGLVSSSLNSITEETAEFKPALDKIDLIMDDLSILILALQRNWLLKTKLNQCEKNLIEKISHFISLLCTIGSVVFMRSSRNFFLVIFKYIFHIMFYKVKITNVH